MSDLAQAIISRLPTTDAAIYRGRITAVNTVNAAVSVLLAAGPITSLQWLASYIPAVNDLVAVVRDGTDWIVLGKLSTATSPQPVTRTVTVSPQQVYRVDHNSKPGEVWAWMSTGLVKQGRYEYQQSYWAGDHTIYIDFRDDFGALAVMSPPELPAGSTITSAKIRLTRQLDGAGALVAPRIYGHTLNGAPSGNVSAYLHGSYGPWQPGSLTQGQTGRWDLPSGWITAFMAGTIKGFAVWAATLAAYQIFEVDSFCELTLTYSYIP